MPTQLNIPLTIIATIMVGYVLMVGKALLMPLVIAVLLFYILLMLTHFFQKYGILGLPVPQPFCLVTSISLVVLTLVGLFSLIGSSLYGIVHQAPAYQEQINLWAEKANNFLEPYDFDVSMLFTSLNVSGFIKGTANTVSEFTKSFALVAIYTLFIALEYGSFQKKVKALSASQASYNKADRILSNVGQGVGSYLKVKTLMSAATGALSCLVLTLSAVPYAGFWGLIIFALNFIPTLGSILAVLMVIPAVLLQLGATVEAGIAVAFLALVQILIGNFIEPRIVGRSLNLSPLIILLSLAFWGTIWGPIGALLCVPLMVVLNMTFAQFKTTEKIAILMSQNGEIRRNF